MRARAGTILYDTLGMVLVFGVLCGGAHLAVAKYWHRELMTLQTKRLRYDGKVLWDR